MLSVLLLKIAKHIFLLVVFFVLDLQVIFTYIANMYV